MKKLFVLSFVWLVLAPVVTLADDKKAEWEILFDGKNLDAFDVVGLQDIPRVFGRMPNTAGRMPTPPIRCDSQAAASAETTHPDPLQSQHHDTPESALSCLRSRAATYVTGVKWRVL